MVEEGILLLPPKTRADFGSLAEQLGEPSGMERAKSGDSIKQQFQLVEQQHTLRLTA